MTDKIHEMFNKKTLPGWQQEPNPITQAKERLIDEFEYKITPHTIPEWLEARLTNRLREGYKIWRDPITRNWKGRRTALTPHEPDHE